MHTLVTKIAATRRARRNRLAEQTHALWEERRRHARRYVTAGPFRFAIG
jgi:hypothetical protein